MPNFGLITSVFVVVWLFSKLLASVTRVFERSIRALAGVDGYCTWARWLGFTFSFDFYLDRDLSAAFFIVMDLSDSMNDFCLA